MHDIFTYKKNDTNIVSIIIRTSPRKDFKSRWAPLLILISFGVSKWYGYL